MRNNKEKWTVLFNETEHLMEYVSELKKNKNRKRKPSVVRVWKIKRDFGEMQNDLWKSHGIKIKWQYVTFPDDKVVPWLRTWGWHRTLPKKRHNDHSVPNELQNVGSRIPFMVSVLKESDIRNYSKDTSWSQYSRHETVLETMRGLYGLWYSCNMPDIHVS